MADRNVGGTATTKDTGKDSGMQGKPIRTGTGTNVLKRPGGTVIRDTEHLGVTGTTEELTEEPTNKVNIEKVQGGTGKSI